MKLEQYSLQDEGKHIRPKKKYIPPLTEKEQIPAQPRCHIKPLSPLCSSSWPTCFFLISYKKLDPHACIPLQQKEWVGRGRRWGKWGVDMVREKGKWNVVQWCREILWEGSVVKWCCTATADCCGGYFDSCNGQFVKWCPPLQHHRPQWSVCAADFWPSPIFLSWVIDNTVENPNTSYTQHYRLIKEHAWYICTHTCTHQLKDKCMVLSYQKS